MAPRIKAITAKPIIPGLTAHVRAWTYLLLLVTVAALAAFGSGSGNVTLVEVSVVVGLLAVFVGAVNTPFELPNTASELVPWLTTERCFWIYRGIVLLGALLAGFGAGNEAQWATFTTALGTIFGLTALTLRTSLVKVINAPEVV